MSNVEQREIQILDQILLLDLSGIHLWTARKKLKPTMLEGKIPPATLASLGSMRVIDPDELKPFEKVKRRATAIVESKGVKFLGGYAIPEAMIHDVVDELNELKDEFYVLKSQFITRYDALVTDWINREWEKSEWRDAIKASATPKAVVDSGLQFGFAACRVAPDGDDRLSGMLNGEVRGLADQLFADTASDADRLLETGLATRGHVTQTTLNTLRRMNAKLKGLMFLSNDVRQLTSYISEMLDELPTSGVVSGNQYNQVVTLVSALSDESSIKNLIKNLNRASGDQDQPFVPPPQQVMEQVKETAPVKEAEPQPVIIDVPTLDEMDIDEQQAPPPAARIEAPASFWF